MRANSSKFRNSQNTRYTRQLFVENHQHLANELSTIKPMYSLYYDYTDEETGKPIPNFRKEYVRLGDPTGYKLAELYLEDYDHWEFLMKCKWFVEAKEQWDRELDAKLTADGMDAVRLIADGVEGVAPAVQLSAAKFLATKAYRNKADDKPKRGRPSKEEIAGNLKQASEDEKAFADDLKRITLVKG